MNNIRKYLPWALVVVLTIAIAFLLGRQSNNNKNGNNTSERSEQPKDSRNKRDRTPENSTTNFERRDKSQDQASSSSDRTIDAFNRNPATIKFSKHARCRMGCRKIDDSEVEEIIAKGNINPEKSDMNAKRAPRYALEGRTKDGQQVRIIVAQDGQESIIVTVIDLDTDWTCNCPGD
jgi:hypothetical protein